MVKDNKMTGINPITIFHQNICGLRKKTDELKSSMYPNFPHILCFSDNTSKTSNLIKSLLMDITLMLHTADKLKKEVEFIFFLETT
jgi:hypothetical protein